MLQLSRKPRYAMWYIVQQSAPWPDKAHLQIDLPRSVHMLTKEIGHMDQEFDKCQEVWSKGETNGFLTEELLVLYIYSRLVGMP